MLPTVDPRRAAGRLAVLALLAGATAAAQAPLTVSGAWVREPVPGRPATAAYAVLENAGPADVQVVGALADVAGTVELHQMTREGDMMKMAPVKSITVPAKGKVELKPGGLHLMLFALKPSIKDGETVTLTFVTSSGGRIRTTATVRREQATK